MELKDKIAAKLQAKARLIENKMKALEVRRDTNKLVNSISFQYDKEKGAFIFKALYYGEFQDRGTYARRQPTDISNRVWQPPYRSKGRGRAGTGITPLHFTNPMGGVGKREILSEITPIIQKEMNDEVKKIIKK